MGSVRSLSDKKDELGALMRTQQGYQNGTFVYLFHKNRATGTTDTSPLNFKIIWANKDCRQRGSSEGGGITVLVNNRWCNPWHVTEKECICMLEDWTVSCDFLSTHKNNTPVHSQWSHRNSTTPFSARLQPSKTLFADFYFIYWYFYDSHRNMIFFGGLKNYFLIDWTELVYDISFFQLVSKHSFS